MANVTKRTSGVIPEQEECPECGTLIRTNFCPECDPCVGGGWAGCQVDWHDHEPTEAELQRYINPEWIEGRRAERTNEVQAMKRRAAGNSIKIYFDDSDPDSPWADHPWSIISFWSEWDDENFEETGLGNYGVQDLVRPQFPDVIFDSESGQFFAYARDKQTAIELAEALNAAAGTDYPIQVEEYQQQNLFGAVKRAGTDLRVPVNDPSYEDEILNIVRGVEGYDTWWWDDDGPDYVFQMEDDNAANEAWEKLDDAGFESRIED